MGCSSSMHVDTIDDVTKEIPKKNKPTPLVLIERQDSSGSDLKRFEENMNSDRSEPDGATASVTSQENNKENGEDNDFFDASTKPMSREKIASARRDHVTKKSLDFVYKNSLASSPSHAVASFGAFPSGTPRSLSNRRPSGIPPPAREIKDSDYISKFASGKVGRRHSDMAEGEEEP